MNTQERHDKATEAALQGLAALSRMDFQSAALAFLRARLACGPDLHPEMPPKPWNETDKEEGN